MNATIGAAIAHAVTQPVQAASARSTPVKNTASRANANRASTVASRACVARRASSRARYSSAGLKNRFVQIVDERCQRLEDLEQFGIEARAERELGRIFAEAEELLVAEVIRRRMILR